MTAKHQVYVILPEEDKQRSKIITFQYDNLYGNVVGQQLAQFIEHFVESNKMIEQNNMMRLESLPLLVDFYVYVEQKKDFPFISECEELKNIDNPLLIENNQGITIVDCTSQKPKYAMMFLGSGGVYSTHYKPLNIQEYLFEYYGKNQTFADKSTMNQIIERLSTYEVLTEDEIRIIFPKMYDTIDEEKYYLSK